jgi:hypothetical protein
LTKAKKLKAGILVNSISVDSSDPNAVVQLICGWITFDISIGFTDISLFRASRLKGFYFSAFGNLRSADIIQCDYPKLPPRLEMKPTLLLFAFFLFLVTPGAALGQVTSSVSTRSEEEKVLKAMLEEIRQLRLEMQRANAVSQQLLITLERTRIEQIRVDTLGRSLQTVQRHLIEATETESRIAVELKESEERMAGADSDAKMILESQTKEMKAQLSTLRRQQEEIRSRERQLNAEWQTAQARLNELNAQLDSMIRQVQTP